MEELLLRLIQGIKDELPWLSLVDEDCGQLESEEDQYPVTFPCVLVGNTDIEWSNMAENSAVQFGTGTITVRLAIDCYDDTHAGSGQEGKMAERQQQAKDLYKCLQGAQVVREVQPLCRVKSHDYTLPGNIKVYEQIYRFEMIDKSAMG